MVTVIPAILEKEFSQIEKKVGLVAGLVDWVQIDLCDGTLVPNTTFLDPEPFRKFISVFSHPELVSGSMGMPKQVRHDTDFIGVNFELHLMVSDPLRYLENFHKAGFKRFFTHIEGGYVAEYIARCYQLGVEVGLAIDGPTDFEKIHPYLDNIDCVLVMAITAGESGRPFREDTIEKIKKIREVDFEIPIAVDGAMDDVNARKVAASGATRINSNSYIFGSEDIKVAIERLKNINVIASEAKQSSSITKW